VVSLFLRIGENFYFIKFQSHRRLRECWLLTYVPVYPQCVPMKLLRYFGQVWDGISVLSSPKGPFYKSIIILRRLSIILQNISKTNKPHHQYFAYEYRPMSSGFPLPLVAFVIEEFNLLSDEWKTADSLIFSRISNKMTSVNSEELESDKIRVTQGRTVWHLIRNLVPRLASTIYILTWFLVSNRSYIGSCFLMDRLLTGVVLLWPDHHWRPPGWSHTTFSGTWWSPQV